MEIAKVDPVTAPRNLASTPIHGIGGAGGDQEPLAAASSKLYLSGDSILGPS